MYQGSTVRWPGPTDMTRRVPKKAVGGLQRGLLRKTSPTSANFSTASCEDRLSFSERAGHCLA